MAIVKTVSIHYPKAGETVTWTITVTNNGPDTAFNAYVRDVLPAGLEFIESDGNYTNNIWYIGNMTNGATAVLNIKTRIIVTDAVITNVANVTSDTPDFNLTNNEDNVTVDIGHEADLSIVKVVSNSTPHFGDIITWTITLTNNGPDTAENVVVNERLPSGLKLLSADTDIGSYKDGIWNVGSLNSGDVVILKLTTEVTILNGTLENIVNVTTSTYDPNKDNNNDSEIVNVSTIADLELTFVSNKDVVNVGDEIIWTITVVNHGPNVALNTIVTHYVNDDVEFVKYEVSKGTFDSSNNIWKIGDLDVGETVTLKLVYKALNTGIASIYANTSCDTPETTMLNNNDASVVKIISNPDPESNKTDVTEKNESGSFSSPLAKHQTGNPLVIIVLALLSIVFVRLKRE